MTKTFTNSTKNKPIPIYAEIEDPTQPSGKRRINLQDLLDPDTIERVRAGVAAEAGLTDSDKSGTQQEAPEKQVAKENRAPKVRVAGLQGRPKKIRTDQSEASDGGKSSFTLTEQYLGTSTAGTRARRTTPSGDFVAPSQVERDEWRCSKFGRNVIKIAHPGGATKTIPKACDECAGCIQYKLDLKVLRYMASNPAERQTVLRFTAPNPAEAQQFRKNAQHNRRANTRRISLLHQNYLGVDEDGSEMPTHGILIWDGPMSEEECERIKKHAEDNGMTDVRVDVIPLDGDTLREMMPRSLTIIKKGGNKVETCRLVRGWVKERKLESGWLDGEQKTERIAEDEQPVTQVEISERPKGIETSWITKFEFERDVTLTEEEKN